ncbi:methyltransferase [Aeromonas veronii]|uniref:methyltransferase n=1 Tax=Aeromonas veronii TaxID=654 RepID=UPI00217D9970|nr:methyltransferase [Aeromonas veronii]UWH29769.1 methyltransferase [Aeromonas veronii]
MDKPGLRDALPQPKLSDTRTEQFWNDFDSNLSAAMAAQQQPVTSPATKRDLNVGLGDVARGVGAGALDLVGGIGELARQASQFGKENAGKQGGDYLEQARANMASKLSPVLDKVAGVGDLAKSGAESLTEGMSGDAKEAIGRSLIDETPEGRLTVGDGAGDIDVWAMKFAQGIGSMVPTLGAGAATAIGRAVTVSMIKRGVSQKLAEQVAAKTVHLSTGAAMATGVTGSVGSAGVNTRESVLGMSFDELSQSDTFRQAFTRIDQDQQTQHLSDEEKLSLAREETANVASRATMSDAKVWGAAAVGSMMGDAMLFKMLAGKAAAGGVLKGAAKGAAGEGISETLEEGVQQYAVNESLNEVAAADIDPMKGVMSSAIEGGLIGMGTGGAVGAVGGARGGKHASQEDGVGTDPVAEHSAPVTDDAAGPAVDPNFASVPLKDGEQAPSASQAEGDLNPLGPSASQFPGVFERDQRGILRVKGDVDALASWAEQADMPYITDGDGIAIPAKYAKQAEKAIKGYRPVAAEPMAEPAPPADMPRFSQVDPIADEPAIKRQGFVMRNGDGQSTGEPEPYVRPQSGDELLYESSANWQAGQPHAESAPVDLEALRKESAQRWRDGNKPEAGTPVRTEEDTEQVLNALRAEGVNGWAGRQDPKLDMPKGQEFIPHGPQAGLPAVVGDGVQQAAGKAKGLPLSDTIFAGGPSHGGQADNTNYARPHLSRDQVDRSLGEESIRDPRSPVRQSIAKAGSATDSVFGPLKSLRITRKGKPFATEKEAAMASRKGKEMPVQLNGGGFGVAEIAEVEQVQAANNSNAINGQQGNNQPQAEVSNEPVTPVPAISSEGQGAQPGAGEPAAAGAGPAVAGLTDRAGSGNPADNTPAPPVPDGQQQDDQTLTAPATDAGAAVSGRIGEDELRDRDLLKEHGGHWKYRSAVGAGWFTANTKEAAIERAEEAYRKAVSKGEPVPTRDERFAQADAELFSEMDRRYGKMSTPELEAEYQRLGGEVGDLQKSGSGEFNGNGGRRTGAAVSNEGARQVGEERLRLGVYMKMRRDRDTAGPGAKSQQIEPANDWRGAKSATDYHAAKRRLFSGEMEFSEFQAMSRSALDNAPSLRAELEKKTRQDLLDQMSRFNAARYKNDKKAVVVEAAYNQLIGDLRWAANSDGNTISETYAIGGARQSIEERVAKALDGLTPERYQQFVNKQRADVAKRDAELAATKEALRDPQTLEQFKTFLKYRSLDKLTPEQRARYEDLIAASNLDKRDQAREVKAATAVTPTASGDIIKTKHTKSGEDLFVVQMGDRVDRDTYNQINAHAKKLGGWYSSYKVGGAVPGFQFKDEAKATEFRGWLTGQGAASAAPSAEAAPTEVTDPDQDNSKSKQVETLRTRAKTLRDKATAALNAERKENTNKRMTEAANARANAESELHFAGLLDAIADGIESGEVTYLRNLANGTQLTELNHALSRSLWNLPPARREALTSQGMIERTEDGRERWSAKATPEMMAEGAQMPGMDYFARNLKDVATKMQGASGFKQAGAKIMALVNAAINRDSKTVSITDPELIAKLKAYTSGVSDYDAKAVKEQIGGYSRLERMGITNHTELRAALRELARLQAGLKKQVVPRDPLAEKMVALKRKLVGNRNAFIDFFPTPESHAADLVALAGIEPGMTVLEPSAGHGMLAEAARAAGAKVDAVELAGDLREILQAKGFGLVGSDFMATTPAQSYDAVVMNPPFSGDMDVDHVRHAYDHLKPGGRLVAIVSATAGDRQNNKNKAFREWFDGLGGSEQAMPEGSFKASLNPTDVRTKIFVIDKPANEAKPLPSPEGKRVTVATPKGQSVEVQYRVMEAADLVASHDFEGNLNHDYPQQLQPRDRSKQTYRVQVGQIAAAPDGARLAASPETDRGAPIVRDGIVESGNGRSIGLRQAYQRGDADAYRRSCTGSLATTN